MEDRTPKTAGMIANAAQKTTDVAAAKQQSPASRLRGVLSADSVRKQFEDVLKENAGAFIASIIDLYNSDTYLQTCDPNKVVLEALKAATLKLPINKQLGFTYIVPYKGVPQFQLGYKGMIQLAQRTGAYRFINADVVYEGEFLGCDKLTGLVDLSGTRTRDKIVGYFAYIETLNGFQKCLYWTREEVEAHAKRYSKSYTSSSSAWTSNFDEMAMKTVIRALLSKYGIMSVEFQTALVSEQDVELADKQIAGAPDLSELQSANMPDEEIETPKEDAQ